MREWLARLAVNAGQSLTEERLVLYFEQLSDIPADVLESIFRQTLRTHAFPSIPTIGQIRKMWEDANTKRNLNRLDQVAEQTWQRIVQAASWSASSVGQFDPQARRAIAAAGGWSFLERCDTAQELEWAHKRFLSHYKAICEAQQVEYLLAGEAGQTILQALRESPAGELGEEDSENGHKSI